MLKLESARYIEDDGILALELIIDGKPARITEPSRELLKEGLVYLESVSPDAQWETLLPPRQTKAIKGFSDEPAELPGITDDSRVVSLARNFARELEKDDSIPLGPVAIPRF